MVAASAAQPEASRPSAEGDASMDESDLPKSLIIPITSNGSSHGGGDKDLFIEIFPEEIGDVPPSVLSKVLRDEDAPLGVWSDAALLYVQNKRDREGAELLTAACELEAKSAGNRDDRVRVLASAGIAALTQANKHGAMGTSGHHGPTLGMVGSKTPAQQAAADQNEELRSTADARFTRAEKIDQLFPMTWIGKGMLNLSMNRLDQAKFFFEQLTLRQCGQVLPALLGMAAVKFKQGDFRGALEMYGRAMTLFPEKSGAATRVGFGMACYRLGQVDRAKAAFRRAHEMDPENVEAMVGVAVLDMASLDETTTKDFRAKTENAIKMFISANLVDHSNAMVQNHLANHYFWKWTPVPGSVSVEQGSAVVKGSQPMGLDPGERIRLGQKFETYVTEEGEGEGGGGGDGNKTFKVRDAWKLPSASGLKLWKKDYDRVVALAKGAYSSTTVPEIQAESLYILARVFHVRDDMENAFKFYEKAVKLAPNLTPARFGLAQTLICEGQHDEATAHLRLLLGTCPSATDALAALGLLEVRSGKDRKEAFTYLKKAIDLDPLNSDLVLLEALALQQQESGYPQSLDRYRKAVRLMENQGKVPAEVWTNIGVLCHETKKYDEALEMYGKALEALDEEHDATSSTDDSSDEDNASVFVRHRDNSLFWTYVDSQMRATPPSKDGDTTLTLERSGEELKRGDHIRLGGEFESEIVETTTNGDGTKRIRIKDTFVPDAGATEPTPGVPIFVKRSNRRLLNASAISIAFNLARLHEAAGRIVPAVELHKAIVKRHPSYVNSYLRLACIARDCGSLKDCSEWLKSACAVAPGNPEVLTLVGNLHLSLCDWAPAQSVFDQLLAQKVPKVEAYAMLSLGNIYFNNLNTPKKYSKHLQYAADFYKRILNRDKANAYAANGLGTVLAEKGELFKAKEVFDRVREVSGDTIPDTLLNLGHIHLAQKKHPEALKMYESYMNRTRNSDAPITSKSQDDDDAEVLLYIAFAYFDWARQTELFNNAKAAPADERYKKCIEYIELAMKKSKKENVLLRYNWCMAKLQAANCVLQKLTRNIRRTAQEVQDALTGLEESLPVVQTFLQWKQEGKKLPISTSMLNDFVHQCKNNIESAKSHLSEELKKESEARELRELQRIEAEEEQKERELQLLIEQEKAKREEEERDSRAKAKMAKVSSLVAGWEQEAEAAKKAAAAKKEKASGEAPPGALVTEDGVFESEVRDTANLFDDSDDDDDDNEDAVGTAGENAPGAGDDGEGKGPVAQETEKDLFGDTSGEESDEELVSASSKRGSEEIQEKGDDKKGNKRMRIEDDDD